MPEVSEDIKKGKFDFNVTITKAWIVKSEDGKSDKHMLKAIASDTGVDHHGERFTEKALNQMINCIKNNDPAPVILLPTHWDTFEIGKVVGGTLIDSPTHKDLKALEVDIELDMEYPQAKSLYKEVESGNAQKQLSVGGHLDMTDDKPYFWEEKQYEMPDGNIMWDYILVLNSLVLDHIAVTRKDKAANGRTGFTEAIAKSLGLEKPDRDQIKKGDKTMPKDKQVESLVQVFTKGIKDLFKSTDEDEAKIQAAKEALAKAKEAMAALGDTSAVAKELGDLGVAPVAKSDEGEEGAEKKPPVESQKSKDEDPENKEKSKDEAADPIDVEALKTQIIDAVTKSVDETQMATFKEISKSLGAAIGEAIQKAVAPVAARIEALEKSAAPSKALPGQEGAEKNEAAKSTEEDSEDNVWKGFFSIPSHVITEKKYNQE